MTTDVSPQQLEANRTITQVIYALHAAALISGVTMLSPRSLNYVKRDDVVGTMYESHFRWQIRTFWFVILWCAIAVVTLPFIVGFFIWGRGLRLVHLPHRQRLAAPHRRQAHVRGLRPTPGHI